MSDQITYEQAKQAVKLYEEAKEFGLEWETAVWEAIHNPDIQTTTLKPEED